MQELTEHERHTIQDHHPNFRDSNGHLYLVRCFRCEPERGRENYALAVAVGVCCECGWPEEKEAIHD